MAKLTIPNINADYGATSTINSNFDLVETAVENTLSRDGTSPNNMTAVLDMGSNRVVNVAQPVDQNDAARLKDVSDSIATSLPDQTGHANKQLQTDGTSASWQFDAAQYIVNTPSGDVSSTDVQSAINELDTDKVPRTSLTGSAKMPIGTTAERDASPSVGYMRHNSDYGRAEEFDGTNWKGLGGAAGAGGDAVFYENDQTVDNDYTLTTGKNAMSAGPVTISTGVIVTVPTGQTWSIV